MTDKVGVKWCMCEVVSGVLRDTESTCVQCGGRDAYKGDPDRPKVIKLDKDDVIYSTAGIPSGEATNGKGEDIDFKDTVTSTAEKPTDDPIVTYLQSIGCSVDGRYSSVAGVGVSTIDDETSVIGEKYHPRGLQKGDVSIGYDGTELLRFTKAGKMIMPNRDPTSIKKIREIMRFCLWAVNGMPDTQETSRAL